MLVLGVAVALTLLVADLVVLVALRWPRFDPASPSGRSVAEAAARRPEGIADLRDDTSGDRPTLLGLSAAAVAVVASTALFGLLFLFVRTRTGAAGLDLASARWAARHAGATSTSVLRVLTYLGSSAVVLPLVVVLGIAEHRRLASRAIPAFLLLVEAGQLLLANVVKVLVGRARPDLDQLTRATGLSFPSGHTTNAAATFAALALLLGRGRTTTARAALAGAAAGLTALVASTRVLLGVHWLTDVLAGAALGWGWAALCSIAYGGGILRFGAPLEPGYEAAQAAASPPAPAGR